MPASLKVLIVEDSRDDAELLARELRNAGFDPDWKRVETEGDFRASLEDPPDLIISDYTMPQFSGLRAMGLLRERGLDIPFLLISGREGEEKAVEAMKQGVTDYLLKDRLGRFGNEGDFGLAQKRVIAQCRRVQQRVVIQA